ncbi:Xaa-Pro peptidase family protein [Rhizobium sp. Root1220]|uniref:M24 family metallopeptidase n=1 Tax=Rhizobium sp. Root1220 TaxID=1736432 RepID=UPI000701E121|nr:Xaa-Pro peptidase family protein [Rhizobium sp. Root1220]KQV70409.1 peptidase [Rhizobium sp. Root1220]
MSISAVQTQAAEPPFDAARLDQLMEAAGIDVLLATSKHNTQYLLGGYKFIFFAAMDAIGHGRYLPIVIYERGKPDHSAYVGNRMEGAEHQNKPFWTGSVHTAAWGTLDAAALAAEHLAKIGKSGSRIGIEPSFLPADARDFLAAHLDGARFVDATHTMERLRAIKTPEELNKLRLASDLITDSMLATIAAASEGSTKTEIIERLRREETNRGLHFEYCLLTLGASHNRAASPQAWAPGEILSIDSGGNYHGYIGDLCRMGVLGEPDAELEDLLAEVDSVQQAGFAKVRAGVAGTEVIDAAEKVLKALPSAGFTDFFCHGMGLITHEAPFLMTNHPVTYDGTDASRPLEAGMVISIETTMLHPTRGFIKLEDTLAITASGYEMFGERGRGWNRGGTN